MHINDLLLFSVLLRSNCLTTDKIRIFSFSKERTFFDIPVIFFTHGSGNSASNFLDYKYQKMFQDELMKDLSRDHQGPSGKSLMKKSENSASSWAWSSSVLHKFTWVQALCCEQFHQSKNKEQKNVCICTRVHTHTSIKEGAWFLTRSKHRFDKGLFLSSKYIYCSSKLWLIYIYIYIFFFTLFMAVLGLCFCARAFSSCGERGTLFIAVRGPLTIAASLVAEHRLQTRRLSNCGSRA